jgi:predicted DNA-binding transcriptional regulator AlpA
MTIAVACKFTGVSRSGYYKYMKRKDKPTQKRGRPTSGEVDEAMAKVIRWVKDAGPRFRSVTAV